MIVIFKECSCAFWYILVATLLTGDITALAADVDATANAPDKVAFFEKNIRPVLIDKCYACHSSDSDEVEGGLMLDTRSASRKGGQSGPAIVPGDARASLLLKTLLHQGELKMPPDEKLPENVIADFRQWIQNGAIDPRDGEPTRKVGVDIEAGREFWSFRSVQAAGVPDVKDREWLRGDIDRFVLARLEANDLTPNKEADRLTLLRRATFDLIGLPPTLEEIEAFEAACDEDPESAYSKLVDRLLSRPEFGQRWGRHWLDVARYAESAGQSRNVSYQMAWRYRNWVIDALNEGMPYDRFILEQIAGDLLPADSQEQRDRQTTATAFLVVGPKLLNEGNKSLVYRMGVVDDQIDTTFRAFLGLTAGCARCHDHKYDPISTRDYYAVSGIFRNVINLAGVKANTNDVDYGLHPLGEGSQAVLDKIAEMNAEFVKLTGEFTKARRAKEAAEAKIAELKKSGTPDEAELARLQEEAETQLQSQRVLGNKRNKLKKSIPQPPPSTMAVREAEAFDDFPLFVRGDVGKPGDVVPRRTLAVLQHICPSEPIPQDGSGRLELARWIANNQNPLTARVMVNRIWLHLFGAGLVPTPDNFGQLGEQPTHPKLLDHLASEFVNNGWSVKKLIRSMMLSRAYQMSSRHNAATAEVDPGNRWLWRMNQRRLEGEAIRDAMLSVAGRLDSSQIDGSQASEMGMFEMTPAHFAKLRNSYAGVTYRSVYLPVVRAGLPDMMKVFDAADPSLVVGDRNVTTVAPQALFLMNNEFVLSQANSAATRIRQSHDDMAQRIELAYRLILSRCPSDAERKVITKYLAPETEASWTDICHILMASAEFRTTY